MSRKWERMVDKNTKNVNRQRQKFGKSLVASNSVEDRLLGRNWIPPVLFISIAFFYMITFKSTYGTTMYWITVISYVLLGVMLFFRRPFLAIRKSELVTRKFGGFKSLEAADIGQITVQKGYVVIVSKNKKERWVFSRAFHRYNTLEMGERLKKFGTLHDIPIESN
jgi:hypothetical protein